MLNFTGAASGAVLANPGSGVAEADLAVETPEEDLVVAVDLAVVAAALAEAVPAEDGKKSRQGGLLDHVSSFESTPFL